MIESSAIDGHDRINDRSTQLFDELIRRSCEILRQNLWWRSLMHHPNTRRIRQMTSNLLPGITQPPAYLVLPQQRHLRDFVGIVAMDETQNEDACGLRRLLPQGSIGNDTPEFILDLDGIFVPASAQYQLNRIELNR